MPKIQGEILDEAIRDTLITFKEYLVDEAFQRTIGGGDFYGSGAQGSLNAYATYVLSTGVDDDAYATILVPDLWINGSISLTVYFCGDGTDTGNFSVSALLQAVDLAQALRGDDIATATWQAIASKSTAKEVQKFTDSSTTNVNADHVLMGLKFSRRGTHGDDTSTDELHILGARIEYLPANRQ